MKLTKKQAKKYFEMARLAENRLWTDINVIEERLVRDCGADFELAIVGNQVVGIGQITDKGRELVIHREDA